MENQDGDETSIKNNSEDMVIKKSTYNYMLMAIIAAAAIATFFGGYSIGTFDDSDSGITGEELKKILSEIKTAPTQQSTQSSLSTNPPSLISISLDDDPVKGNPDAPITIVEFSDFQCPFCARFHSITLPQLEANYIDSGKVKFVYRDFPIQSIHPNAVPAALASECADEQGMFWEYHDLVFENQKKWQGLSRNAMIGTFEQYALELGLNTSDFNTCFESGKYGDEVTKDLQDGVSYGVTGTPGFFIGNDELGYVKIIGAQPYPVFERLIEDQIARLDI